MTIEYPARARSSTRIGVGGLMHRQEFKRSKKPWSTSIAGPPIKPDGEFATGKVGIDVALEEAYQHARLVGMGLLAVMRQELGSLDKVVRVGRVFGMMNAAPSFTDHPKVINGCSDLLVEVFGDRGRHARCAVGMASLPFNISVEIEAVVEVHRRV